ncbi:MAG TPA: hypothetical protein VK934_04120 [Fimbriimonas sp.]|nr:hypothetical protein [Fimbriimonas sp.]
MNKDQRPLTEQELIDWERWSKREIKWEGRDVARLLAMVRQLQAKVRELEDDRR